MKQKSKSMKEVYLSMYDSETIKNNPLKAVEARGFLKCLKQFMPSEDWIEVEDIMLIMLIKVLSEKWR